MASITSVRASQIPVDAGGPISTAVADCEANFKKSVEATHSNEVYAGALEDLESKFLSWASYLGVFADTQVCLDRRLERHPQYRELVLYVLDTLNMNLLRMITAIGLDNSETDDSTDDELERQDVKLKGIQSSVNELNRLAMYIRQSSMSSLDARVKAFRSKKPGEIWRFQTTADIALKTLYPLMSGSLHQQLSSSMLDRYAKLLYWKVHDRKLQTDRRRRPKPADFHVSIPTEQIQAGMPDEASFSTSQNYPKPSSSGERRRGLELRPVSGTLTAGDDDEELFGSEEDTMGNGKGERSTLDDSLEDLTSTNFGEDDAENLKKHPVSEDKNDLQPEFNEVVSEQHMDTATAPEHFDNQWDFLINPNPLEGERFESPPTDPNERYTEGPIDSLRRDLQDAIINTGDPDEFVPISSLRGLITEARIDALLQNRQGIRAAQTGELTKFILEEAIRIFAVLVWINRIDCIGTFYESGLTDDILPITKGSNDSYTVSGVSAQYNGKWLQDIIFTIPWTSTSREILLDAQWRFLAPVFQEGRLQYSVLDRCPLPFWDMTEENDELFSHVQTGVMHKSHFKLGNSESEFDSAVRTEVNALDEIKTLRQQHLLLGLAGAIEKLHNHTSRIQHNGIRPEHIVCFRSGNNYDRPLLAIAGHGSTGFSDMVVRATERAGDTVGRARLTMYDPPERELYSSRSISQRWDIWSIGCVYLEFLIWVLYGKSALIRFRSDLFADEQGGKFYEIVQNPRGHYGDLQGVIAGNPGASH
ncbi:tol-like protein [Colletotrichum kahawae]|uniref:Tol-like protein n=1 Tax=Colletotrichum kahawae TaxID=34407 RepID=A0AAE0D367_COLKA|nr:tol-like protein [Colletotrichum kahawae]